MSDVIVSTTESTTDVTTTNDVTTVAITNTVVEISQATAGLQGVPGSNSDPTYVFVTNKTGATLAKGSIVYVSGANGTHTQVSLALATGDVTSARTLGWLAEDIANNATGLCCVEGYLDGINTQGVTEGAQLYLSPTTPGAFTETKPSAPDHMVYVGFCSKASAGNGRVFVFVQNGAELEELHDVKIVSPQNNDLLRYVSGTALWENVASTAITVGSAIVAGTASFASSASTANTAGTAFYSSTSGSAITITGSITKSQVSDFTSGTVASASTAQQAGTAVTISGSITRSQVSDFTSGTVTSASTAQTAGTASFASTASSATNAATAVSLSGSITISQITDLANGTVAIAGTASFADQAGTATYSTTSGSALTITGSITKSQVSDFTSGTVTTISGSITNSQVSDYASGTVANISGTVTQAQVSGLGSALAGKAGLADNNTFTGTNTFSNFTTFQAAADAIPIRIFGANGQSADLFSVNDYLTNTQFEILSDGRAQSLKGIIATVSGTASIPLVVRGTAGQSANLLEAQNSGSTAVFRVFATGGVSATGSAIVVNGASWPFTITQSASSTATITNGGVVRITNAPTGSTRFEADSSAVPVVVRGASGQTANLQEWQDSNGTRQGYVSSGGNGLVFPGVYANYELYVQSGGSSVLPLRVRGAANQSANLQEWQSNTGGTAARVNSTGSIITSQGFAVLGGASISGSIATLLQTSNSARIPLVVQGAASQSANLQEWQTSSGSTALRVNSTGQLALNTASNLAQLGVVPASTATVGVVVQGLSGQSANLQTWQNSSGGLLAVLDPSGIFYGSIVTTLNSYASLAEENAGGRFRLTKATAIASSPGANLAKIYLRDGTNAGTLKLVVRAGTAGAETTILDNIPQ